MNGLKELYFGLEGLKRCSSPRMIIRWLIVSEIRIEIPGHLQAQFIEVRFLFNLMFASIVLIVSGDPMILTFHVHPLQVPH